MILSLISLTLLAGGALTTLWKFMGVEYSPMTRIVAFCIGLAMLPALYGAALVL